MYYKCQQRCDPGRPATRGSVPATPGLWMAEVMQGCLVAGLLMLSVAIMLQAMKRFAATGAPIIVTETGIPDKDDSRRELWAKLYLKEVRCCCLSLSWRPLSSDGRACHWGPPIHDAMARRRRLPGA